MSTLYTFRRTNERTVEVAKFTDRDRPEVVYPIYDGWRCSCPGMNRSNKKCTHVQMVDEFEELGVDYDGVMYDRDNDRIYRPFADEEFTAWVDEFLKKPVWPPAF